MAHSRLSPSSADRWFACPGSVTATAGLPDVPSSYAEEGSRAHELLEMSLRLGVDPNELVDLADEQMESMALAVGHAVDFIEQYAVSHPHARVLIERELVWGRPFERPDLFGTSDIVLVDPSELVVIDYKHGQGVLVEAIDNRQLLLYLIGARAEFGRREKYRKVIIQPRARHEQGPIRIAEVGDAALDRFQYETSRAINATEAPSPTFAAGDWCRWCRANGSCITLANHCLQLASATFSVADAVLGDVVQPSPPTSLSTVGIGALLAQVPVVEVWLRAVEGEALRRALAGEEIPGQKLVLGRSSRRWMTMEDETIELLIAAGLTLDEVAPRSVVSPAGAEKLLKHYKFPKQTQNVVMANVVKTPGNPTLAPLTDPRDEYIPFSDFPEVPND